MTPQEVTKLLNFLKEKMKGCTYKEAENFKKIIKLIETKEK